MINFIKIRNPIALSILGVLVTGTLNTILSKLQTLVCLHSCEDENARRMFEQPIWMTLNAFLGEMLCGLVFLVNQYSVKSKNNHINYTLINESDSSSEIEIELEYEVTPRPVLQGKQNLLLLIPTICDIIATTLMNIGILFVSASIYQMLVGIVVVFTALLSSIILKQKYRLYKIISLFGVLLGAGIVGASPSLHSNAINAVGNTSDIFIGVVFVVTAQIFAAGQFVFEEKIIIEYEVLVLKMIGLEGLFGTIITLLFMVIGHFLDIASLNEMLDFRSGLNQIILNKTLFFAFLGLIISVALYSWFCLNVTKYTSSTSRTTIDCCRTLLVWIISISLSWEDFLPIQILGFVIMVLGTLTFNDVFLKK